MKLECIKDKLTQAVSKATHIAGKKLSLQILNNIFLQAKKGLLIVKSTNLDLGIEITVPAKIHKEGQVVVSGETLYSLLENIKNEQNISIEKDADIIHIVTKHTSNNIKTYPDSDFPTIPLLLKEKSVTLSSNEFSQGLKSVHYSATTLNMKPELSSVYIYSQDELIVFAATDSFRLAEKKIKVKKATKIEPILIPIKNIPDISRVLDEMNGEVAMVVDKNQISFSDDYVYLTSRVVEGNFPDYKQIIPPTPLTKAIVLKEDLLNSLNISQLFSDKFNQINITVSPKGKIFRIVAKNIDVGESTYTLDAAISGEEISLNFNHKYIRDCFQSIHTDSVLLELSGIGKPMLIRGVGDKTFLYLVMPMNK